jgi:hypothetical protein
VYVALLLYLLFETLSAPVYIQPVSCYLVLRCAYT